MHYTYDRDGVPIPLETCEELRADVRYRTVQTTVIDATVAVSTVWLGIDHAFAFNDRTPLIFETMVFPITDGGVSYADYEGLTMRYATLHEAAAGHAETVEKVIGLIGAVGDATSAVESE